MIERAVRSRIESRLFKGKAIIIYGALQVGKTTLIREIQKRFSEREALYLNCDEPDVRQLLTDTTLK